MCKDKALSQENVDNLKKELLSLSLKIDKLYGEALDLLKGRNRLEGELEAKERIKLREIEKEIDEALTKKLRLQNELHSLTAPIIKKVKI